MNMRGGNTILRASRIPKNYSSEGNDNGINFLNYLFPN